MINLHLLLGKEAPLAVEELLLTEVVVVVVEVIVVVEDLVEVLPEVVALVVVAMVGVLEVSREPRRLPPPLHLLSLSLSINGPHLCRP
jgi:hypothetical protein